VLTDSPTREERGEKGHQLRRGRFYLEEKLALVERNFNSFSLAESEKGLDILVAQKKSPYLPLRKEGSPT